MRVEQLRSSFLPWPLGCISADMCKLPQWNSRSYQSRSLAKGWLFPLAVACAILSGCGGGGASPGTNPLSPPATISVSIAPNSGSVLLGKNLAAHRGRHGDQQRGRELEREWARWRQQRRWNDFRGGIFTAPLDLPSPPNVQITATIAVQHAILSPCEHNQNSGRSHPPPNNNPGPRDATKIGWGFVDAELRKWCSAECSAAAQVVEPRFPRVSAIIGNRSSGIPDFLASSFTSRGFG
jgi:hypothetical protein